MISAQELLTTDPTIRSAFAAYYSGKLQRSIDDTIASLSTTPTLWRAFCRSTAGRKLEETTRVQLGAYIVAMDTPAPTAVTPTPAQPVTTVSATPPRSPRHIPVAIPDIALKEENAPPAPALPTPTRRPTGAPLAMPDGTDVLGMLGQVLRATGYVPDQAITAQRCEEIAFEQAQSVVEMVFEDLEKQGKIGTKRSVIELKAPGLPTRHVEGSVPAWFPRLVKLHACRIPALLVGPAGSGKSTAAEKLAQLVGQPFHRISIAAGTDEGQLQGWLHPSRHGMLFEYVASVMSHAYEYGGIVLIDDIDLGDPNALGILNAALDNGPWHIALRHDNPAFTRHDGFYLLGASNTYGHGADRQYAGANQLDERTLSRFRAGQIRCDYDAALETAEFGNHKPHAAESLVFGHRLRTRLRALPGQHRDVSTRDIAARYKMLDQFTVGEAWYGQFADWSDDECRQVHVTVDHTAMTAEME